MYVYGSLTPVHISQKTLPSSYLNMQRASPPFYGTYASAS